MKKLIFLSLLIGIYGSSISQNLHGFDVSEYDDINLDSVTFSISENKDLRTREKIENNGYIKLCSLDSAWFIPNAVYLQYFMYRNDSLVLSRTHRTDTSYTSSFGIKILAQGFYKIRYFTPSQSRVFVFYLRQECEENIIPVSVDSILTAIYTRLDSIELCMGESKPSKIDVIESELRTLSISELSKKYYKSRNIEVEGQFISTCDFANYAELSCATRSESAIFEAAILKAGF